MMAYQSSILSVTKYSQAYVVLKFPLSLCIDCIYSTPQTVIYATPNDYVFKMKQKLQETHQLMRELMDVEQERQKTYYYRNRNGSSYKVGEEVIVFNPTLIKGETRKFTSFYRGPYAIIKVEDNDRGKIFKVHFDRLKKYKILNKRKTIRA